MADEQRRAHSKQLDEYAERVIQVLREQGLPGNIAYDEEAGRLLNESMDPFYLMDGFGQYQLVAEDERAEWLSRYVGVFLKRPRAPQTWDEAKGGVLPRIRPRLAHVCWELRHEVEGLTKPDIPYAELTEHLVLELAFPVPDATVALNRQDFERYDISPDEAFQQAQQNLLARTSEPQQWLQNPEMPGVLRSPWKDRFDATRVLFGTGLGLPFEGPPVAIATSEGCLVVADSANEDALFNLARASRAELERTKTFLWLRPLRLNAEQPRLAHWLPKPGTTSHRALSLLYAINDKSDADEHGALLDRFFEREDAEVRSAPMEMMQGPEGAGVTVAIWNDAPALALPKADLIEFRQGDQSLALVQFHRALEELPDEMLQEAPGYPLRFLTHGFPDAWQIEQMREKPE